MKKRNYFSGFSLVEAVVATAIIFVVVSALAGLATFVSRASVSNTLRVQANYLLEEGLEATRLLRDSGWNTNIASQVSGVPFYLVFTAGSWAKSNQFSLIDNTFERTVVLNDVYRDSSSEIVTQGGTLDPNTKKVTVSVSWSYGGATTTKALSTYLTNIFND